MASSLDNLMEELKSLTSDFFRMVEETREAEVQIKASNDDPAMVVFAQGVSAGAQTMLRRYKRTFMNLSNFSDEVAKMAKKAEDIVNTTFAELGVKPEDDSKGHEVQDNHSNPGRKLPYWKRVLRRLFAK